jgi:hypothetical protein
MNQNTMLVTMQYINTFNSYLIDNNNTRIALALTVFFTTVVGPSTASLFKGLWNSDLFRVVMLFVIGLLVFANDNIPNIAIILLVFFVSTQIVGTQHENFETAAINKKLENFAPSEEHINETFHISPEYFKENRDAPLEGTHADVPQQKEDDYTLYQETDINTRHEQPYHPESHEPVNGYDPLSGKEIASF